jgi:hypothetical protein
MNLNAMLVTVGMLRVTVNHIFSEVGSSILLHGTKKYTPIAQLDRATDF